MHWLDNDSARLFKSQNEIKTIGLTSDFKRSKFIAEERQISGNQTIPCKIKIKGGSQNFQKFGKRLQLQQLATTW